MNLEFEKEVGLRIRKIRERQNLTQAEVPARLPGMQPRCHAQRAGQYRGRAAASQALKEPLRVTYEEIPEQGVKKE